MIELKEYQLRTLCCLFSNIHKCAIVYLLQRFLEVLVSCFCSSEMDKYFFFSMRVLISSWWLLCNMSFNNF